MKKKLATVILVMALFISSIPISLDTAKAGDPNYFTITFHSNCSGGHIGSSSGPVVQSVNMSYQNKALELKKIDSTKAYLSGYVFLGWYSSPIANNGCKRVTTSNYANETHLYAHWAKVESTIVFNDLGETATTRIIATYGHSFVAKNPGAPSWITSISPSSAKGSSKELSSATITTVSARASKLTSVRNVNGRSGSFRLTDSYSNSMGVNVLQRSPFTRIENTLKAKRNGAGYSEGKSFFNECKAGQPSTYNFYNCRLFGDSNSSNTWCTDSALVDLLNRAITYDQMIASDFHYDVRDVLLTNCINTSWISSVYFEKNSSTGMSVYHNAGDSGGERLNYNKDIGAQLISLDFSNRTYGAHGKTPKNYRVTIDQTPRNDRGSGTNYNKILKLLESHPEGLWIQVKHKSNDKDHSYMVVGNDSALWFIDNGNCLLWNGSTCTGTIRFASLSDHGYTDEKEMLNDYLLSVGYVVR